mmetsp:Transcript_116190/g.290146  ORF Transcript_116190/g.290146 Transcript_116190/m.290146 type:complete len:130 (-) Transcript_116190:163-552(-)
MTSTVPRRCRRVREIATGIVELKGKVAMVQLLRAEIGEARECGSDERQSRSSPPKVQRVFGMRARALSQARLTTALTDSSFALQLFFLPTQLHSCTGGRASQVCHARQREYKLFQTSIALAHGAFKTIF